MGVSLVNEKNHLKLATALAEEFSQTAAERDQKGGTAREERNLLRASGLLKLAIPKAQGGFGEKWPYIFQIVREIAKADGSLGHVFGYHFLQSVTPHFFGTPEQRDYFYRGTAEHNWFWGNAINPRDRRLTVTPDGTGYRLNGIKYFCSGSQDSDILVVCAEFLEEEQPRIFVVPTKREGITVHDDWDGIGQRQTDSGTVTFENVWVEKHEFLETPGIYGSSFATLRTCLTQLLMTNVFVGIAKGAFAEAQKYTQSYTRSWVGEKATEDPLILRQYGELWAQISAAEQLTNQAALVFQQSWEAGTDLIEEQRGETAISVATAKVIASKAALETTSKIFELMGARATENQYRYDRFWRNIRTYSLHDPIEVKIQELGHYVLNHRYPVSGLYA